MSLNETWTIFAPIVIVGLVAIFGTIATINTSKIYQKGNESPYTPPGWVFMVVWPILYVLITIAWVRANSYITDENSFQLINWLFTINMILNLSWSLVAFGDQNPVGGLVIIILMLVSAGILIWLLRSDVLSMIFIIVYFLWLLFATYLNYYIVVNNCPKLNKYCDQVCPLLV